MNKDELRMQMADLNLEILSDLKKDLANEKSKPSIERDESFISELEDLIAQTEEEVLSESQARSLDKSLKMLDEYKSPRKIKLFKYLSVAAAVLIVFWGLNTASMKVFGQNMFSTAYQLAKGGITISTDDPSKSDELTVSPSDPYGIKAKCAECGFFPKTPSYIPEGFELDSIDEETNEFVDLLVFYYKNGDTKLNFHYTNFKTQNDIPAISLPTDSYNIEEVESDDYITYILKEDKQFTATFLTRRIRHTMFSENLDYEECQKILESLT